MKTNAKKLVPALIVLVVQSPQVGGLSQGFSNMVDYMESHQMSPLPGNSALALVLGENYWNVGKTKEIKARVLHL